MGTEKRTQFGNVDVDAIVADASLHDIGNVHCETRIGANELDFGGARAVAFGTDGPADEGNLGEAKGGGKLLHGALWMKVAELPLVASVSLHGAAHLAGRLHVTILVHVIFRLLQISENERGRREAVYVGEAVAGQGLEDVKDLLGVSDGTSDVSVRVRFVG